MPTKKSRKSAKITFHCHEISDPLPVYPAISLEFKGIFTYITTIFTEYPICCHRIDLLFLGDASQTSPPTVIVPDSVSFSPPPYSGDNTGVPHPGPPPYSLGSGSSINSTTLPRCPPPYHQVTKDPPPSYSSAISLALPEAAERRRKKTNTTEAEEKR